MIPLTVVIATKNEEARIGQCLIALKDFSEIIVVDSNSRDRTVEIAKAYGARVENFSWNGQYPKKRQWILDAIKLKHDWVFFVDADEIVTSQLIEELENLFAAQPTAAGYFVKGFYKSQGKILRHGLQNNKLCLFNKNKIEFPVVNDLDIPGMGEMEGHYQPVLKADFKSETIGQLKAFLIHDALDDERAWKFRHEKYARWEAGMNERNAWPTDPVRWRNFIKIVLQCNKFRPEFMFLISFIAMGGFLDGKPGLIFSRKKYQYYKLIAKLKK